MKHVRKLLSTLLALVLLCGLLPAAASIHVHAATVDECPSGGDHDWIPYESPADCTWAGMREYQCTKCYATKGYEEIPPLGHSWGAWRPISGNLPATCTQGTVEVRTCTRCGETESRDVPALGHSWNGGVTANGVTTYTCTRCGESYTETAAATPAPAAATAPTPTPAPELAPAALEEEQRMSFPSLTDQTAPELLNLLRNVPPVAADGDLVITQQPVGGLIAHGGGLPLSIGVEGGVGDYTYEWHIESDLSRRFDNRALDAFIQNYTARAAESYSSRRSSLASGFHGAWMERHKGKGQRVQTSSYSYGSELYTAALNDVALLSLGDHILSGSDSAVHNASSVGKYYCVVRDAAGHKVVSETAEVSYELFIISQPKNANMAGTGSATLRCSAAGGTPFGAEYVSAYAYTWLDGQGDIVGTGSEIEIHQEGEYYCIAEDASIEQTASEVVTVYDAPPLKTLVFMSHYSIRPPEETAPLAASFSGGVPPYTVEWQSGGTILSTEQYEAGGKSEYAADALGDYRFTVIDAMGERRENTFTVEYNQLYIAGQPEGGILPYEGTLTLEVLVQGEDPKTYTLRRDGEDVSTHVGDPRFAVDTPGIYTIYIEDAAGHWALSDPAEVRPHGFSITDVNVHSYNRNDLVYVTVEGGTPPYSARIYSPDDLVASVRFYESRSEAMYIPYDDYLDEPLLMSVKDANGLQAEKTFYHSYLSSEPLIVSQSDKMVALPYSESGDYSYTLFCDAIVAEGYTLSYEWQIWLDGDWIPLSIYSRHTISGAYLNNQYYRCVVTNDQTGGETVSKPVNVFHSIECIRAEQTDSRTMEFEFVFAGSTIGYRSTVCYSIVDGVTDLENYYYISSKHKVIPTENGIIVRIWKLDKTLKFGGVKYPAAYAVVVYQDSGSNMPIIKRSPPVACTW